MSDVYKELRDIAEKIKKTKDVAEISELSDRIKVITDDLEQGYKERQKLKDGKAFTSKRF